MSLEQAKIQTSIQSSTQKRKHDKKGTFTPSWADPSQDEFYSYGKASQVALYQARLSCACGRLGWPWSQKSDPAVLKSDPASHLSHKQQARAKRGVGNMAWGGGSSSNTGHMNFFGVRSLMNFQGSFQLQGVRSSVWSSCWSYYPGCFSCGSSVWSGAHGPGTRGGAQVPGLQRLSCAHRSTTLFGCN